MKSAILSQDRTEQLWVINPHIKSGPKHYRAYEVKEVGNNHDRSYGEPCWLNSDHAWKERDSGPGLLVKNYEGIKLGVICPICFKMMQNNARWDPGARS